MGNLEEIQASYSGADKLRRLLLLVNNGMKAEELATVFDVIAKCLLGEVRIKKGGETYDILEVEFYYRSENYHQKEPTANDDKEKEWKVTYPRKAEAGDWFFHSYGMDLCFKSDYEKREDYKTFYGGGILIRSIRRCCELDAVPIIGSGRVCDTLFSVYNAFANEGYDENMPKIVDNGKEAPPIDAESTYRYHIEDIRHEVKEKLRYTTKDFLEYRALRKTKDWVSYFDRRHLGHSRKIAEGMIKDDKLEYDYRTK